MSLLNDDNAKMISMITEGKIQAGEADLAQKKTDNRKFPEENFGEDVEKVIGGVRTPTTIEQQIRNKIKQKPRKPLAVGGSLLEDDMAMNDMPMDEPMMEQPVMDEPMMEAPKENMLPDEEMENEFIDFILDEALSEEEEDMLMSILEQDDQLSMLFDKVIDVAQEFAGSGPVEGPGSGVSDSIPARLSDGEFVFTAAAVNVIGADNLMALMKDAEAQAGDRQELAEGGEPDEETVTMKVQEQKEPKVQIAKATVNSTRGLLDEDEISKGIKSKMMLDPNQKHIRS